MRKLERLIRKELKKFPGWRFIGAHKRHTHYLITNGKRKVRLASTPRSGNQTAIRNMRQEIRRIESGQWI